LTEGKMHVRPVLPTEAEPIAALLRSAYADVAQRFGLTSQNCSKHPSNFQAEWVTEALSRGIRYFVLEEAGTLIGCVALEQPQPEVCYLERLAVLPQYRHKQAGKKLVEHIFAEAQQLGADRIEIGIIAEHKTLKAWYESFGFTEIRRASFQHLPFEVMFMRKELVGN